MTVAIAAVFTSCKKDPIASFTYDPENPVQYDVVTFTNTSSEADSYFWEIGSGVSTDASPVVRLTDAGDYTVKLTATGEGGSQTIEKIITVAALDNHYMLGDKKIDITTDFIWKAPHGEGDNYLELTSAVEGQDNPDVLSLFPKQYLDGLPGTYTWDGESETPAVGTYDHMYYANFTGAFGAWDWLGLSKIGTTDLVIEEMETDVYKITGTMTISAGNLDASWAFVEESEKTLTISYIGAITPIAK